MTSANPPDITRLLADSAGGDASARERLATLVYEELRRQASLQRRRHRPYDTLKATALVHEAYLKLSGRDEPDWQDRVHFFRVAGRVMRDVLVDYARRRRATKRGGGQTDLSLDEALDLPVLKDDEILAVHEALLQLEQLDTVIGAVCPKPPLHKQAKLVLPVVASKPFQDASNLSPVGTVAGESALVPFAPGRHRVMVGAGGL